MKTSVLVLSIGLAILQSVLLVIGTYELNIEGLLPAIILRFVLLLIVSIIASKAIALTILHRDSNESWIFRILNNISLVSTFIFSPLSGLLIGLFYFYFSDWAMNMAAPNMGFSVWIVFLRMCVFLIIPVATILLARRKWSKEKK